MYSYLCTCVYLDFAIFPTHVRWNAAKKTSSDKHHFVYLFNVCVLLSVCFQIADIYAQLLKFYSLGVFFLQPRQVEVRHSAEKLPNALCATWQMKYWDSRCIEGFGIFLLAEVGIYCKNMHCIFYIIYIRVPFR